MTHRFGDLFNPPGLTNFLGCVQAGIDPVSITSFNFPPLGTGETVSGVLYLNDRLFSSLGVPVTYTWWPDRIVREAEHEQWLIKTTTVLPRARTAALVRIEIQNRGGAERELRMRLALRGGVTRQTQPWTQPVPPIEYEHEIQADAQRAAIRFIARDSGAVRLAGLSSAEVGENATLSNRWRVAPGRTYVATFVDVLASSGDEADRIFDEVMQSPDAIIEDVRVMWNDELRSLFTPKNEIYPGSLPELETDDSAVARIYWMGALGTAYFRRDTPNSALSRSWDTLMPRYWQSVTFLWDYSLSSMFHALVDPTTMRTHLEHWMTQDIHTCFGTEWLTGGPVGGWYSVNDYAMSRMIFEYLRWSGDSSWLDKHVGSASVRDHLRSYATNWERFRSPNGLADYGGIGNLLECVSTYVNEIAAMNAANVFTLRFAAEALEDEQLRAQASALVKEVQKLYVDGQGFWNTRRPDGSLVPVRHCYDFITVLSTIPEDLSALQKEQMVSFFERELKTPAWMRALSDRDPDASFSVRPDHQWTGAYPAWPPQAVQALYRAGRSDLGLAWLHGLSRSANQGPFGQAHFAEEVVAPEGGGARKAPGEFPYITDWACSSNAAFCNIVIESIFGVKAGLKSIEASPEFGSFDPNASLRNLQWQGRLYDVDSRGLHEVRP
ncbi:MAG: glucosidase family protein [Actinomycetota bacterium]